MKIGEYAIVGTSGEDRLGVREGTLYRLLRCSDEMTDSRAAAVSKALHEAVLPGSNVLAPAFFEADEGWFAAVPYREDVYRGVPLSYLRVLPEKARRHMILLAVSAVETLARGGLIHGSLRPECFRITVSKGGVLCVVLEDLRHVGTSAHPPLKVERHGDYASPETRISKAPTAASDVFSLALCLHTWLAGELPRCRQRSDIGLTRKNVWIADAVPVWARSVLLSMLEANPTSRPKIADVFKRLQGGKETCADEVYASSELPDDEAAEIRELLLQESELLNERYRAT